MLRASRRSSSNVSGRGVCGGIVAHERDVEPVGEVAGPEEHGCSWGCASAPSRRLGRARRQQRRPRCRRRRRSGTCRARARAPRAARAGRAPRSACRGSSRRRRAREHVQHAVALEQLDVAADRRGAHRHVERHGGSATSSPLASTATSWSPLPSRYLRPDVLGDLLGDRDVGPRRSASRPTTVGHRGLRRRRPARGRRRAPMTASRCRSARRSGSRSAAGSGDWGADPAAQDAAQGRPARPRARPRRRPTGPRGAASRSSPARAGPPGEGGGIRSPAMRPRRARRSRACQGGLVEQRDHVVAVDLALGHEHVGDVRGRRRG